MGYKQNNPLPRMKSALKMMKADKKMGMHRDSAMYMGHKESPAMNYDTDKGSHAHPHDGPKKYGAMKGDQSATKKDYESGGPGMMSKGPHKEKWERQANRARRANERGNTERGAKLEAKARKNYKN